MGFYKSVRKNLERINKEMDEIMENFYQKMAEIEQKYLREEKKDV